MKSQRVFQKLLILIFLLFIAILVFVLIYAHNRKSGQTGLNMSRVQEMRIEASKEKKEKL